MIDLTAESAVSLAEATKWLPTGRNDSRPHVSTLLRWITSGAKGPDGSRVRLDAVRIGGRWVTSREALQRFIAALTPQFGDAAPAPRTAGQDRRATDRAGAELQKIGI
jgi:hypothetical protein